jgi:hypothetical protein
MDVLALVAHVLPASSSLDLCVALVAQRFVAVLHKPRVGQDRLAHPAPEAPGVPRRVHRLDDTPDDELICNEQDIYTFDQLQRKLSPSFTFESIVLAETTILYINFKCILHFYLLSHSTIISWITSAKLTLHSTKLCTNFKIFRKKYILVLRLPQRLFKHFPKFEGHTSSGMHTNETLNLLTKL